jgi:hypothetical protein
MSIRVVQRGVLTSIALGVALAFSAAPVSAQVTIDNDLPTSTVGHWAVDVQAGGENRAARITAVGTPSGTVFTATDVIFDYFTYVDPGAPGGALRLNTATSGPTLTGDDQVTSSGSFAGANGLINWTAVSSIPNSSTVMTNTFTLTAAPSTTLGTLRLFQYLDEDVLGAGNDLFFTRGSSAAGDLQLFTIDIAEAIGVSHSGAFSSGQGLANATFAGWAACEFDQMRPTITGATGQPVSPTGVMCASLLSHPFNHPIVGPGFGNSDVVSVLAWDVNAAATSATIVTTLGGIPIITQIPGEDGVALPAPASLGLVALGLIGLGLRRRRKTA